MSIEVKSPSDRAEEDNWQIDVEQFCEGPDTWSSSERQGWSFYLVETIPYRDIYALTKYSWRNNREDELVDIGTISISGNINHDDINEVFEENNIEPLTEGQFRLVRDAYESCLVETVRNATLDKGFEIFDHTIYTEVDEFDEYLGRKIDSIVDKMDRILEDVKIGEPHTYPEYYSEEEVEQYDQYEELTENQRQSLSVISNGVERPHENVIQYADHCQLVGDLTFKTLEPFKIRAIELVQNGVFHNNAAVAVVQALREEGLSQKEIAEVLGKDKSTVSKQVSTAKNLTNRARWHSANVTSDGRM